MNLVVFAMRRPVAVVMMVVTLLGGGIFALNQMRVDIFPSINAPQIYVVNNYAGMDPSQIEGIITNVYEQNFQYVDGLQGVESKNIQNLVLLKLTFYPGTDMAAAMSQVVSLSNRARGQMPPSVLPPFVMRFDAANVPIGYLVLESKTRPLGQLADLGLYRIRPLLISQIPGTVSFSPFGSNTRAIVITVDPDRLRAHNFSPEDLVTALGTGNVVAPSGNLYTQGEMPLVPTNATVADPQEMGNIPIQPGKNVYIRDVATIQDTTDINYGCALVNGRRSIYIPVVKKDTASTLTVVQQIRDSMRLFQSVVPEDVTVRYEFDESPTVRAAIKSVATEGGIGALLTGLMILIFLRDVRTVIVVVLGIPLALTAALVGLWLTGNTINIMSLGGLALSIGILVDMAIVTVENTHVQMRRTESVARAVRRSDAATVTSRLLAMLCILSVFIPTFLMQEPVRSLFMPLTIAVGFAMIAAFLMSSSLVPVLSVWLIRYRAEEPAAKDRRIIYCRRLLLIMVVCAAWMFSEMEYVTYGKEAKDGVCISGAIRGGCRGSNAGILEHSVGTGSAAICRARSDETGIWRGRVHRRGVGMCYADHRARSRRTRPVADRSRRGTGAASGGRSKKKTESEPELEQNLKTILEVRTAGDPDEKDVLWTDLSPRQIAEAAEDMGTPVSPPVVQAWMEEQKLARHKIEKVLAGGHHPDRDAQFRRIAELKAEYSAAGNPVFSLDTKAKEHLGQLFRKGRVWTQRAFQAFDHDFPSWATGVVIPHGIYDLVRNRGHINIGLSHDTSQFACDSFRWYWNRIGRRCYPDTTSILLLCDCGGSNSAAQYLFKHDLQRLVNDLGIEIRVAHYPSYCSKFNPIERRFFPHVTRACQGMLLDTLDTVVGLMRKASTTTGLQTTVNVIRRVYEIGRKVADDFKTAMPIFFDNSLPKWNYTAHPQ